MKPGIDVAHLQKTMGSIVEMRKSKRRAIKNEKASSFSGLSGTHRNIMKALCTASDTTSAPLSAMISMTDANRDLSDNSSLRSPKHPGIALQNKNARGKSGETFGIKKVTGPSRKTIKEEDFLRGALAVSFKKDGGTEHNANENR